MTPQRCEVVETSEPMEVAPADEDRAEKTEDIASSDRESSSSESPPALEENSAAEDDEA